jgi:37-kD nucleoid-associated bacterial protein
VDLTVTNVVVHDVPRPGDPEPLVLTESVVDLDQQLRDYFRGKILDSLGARGLAVVADRDQAAVVRDGVKTILADEDQHVLASRQMAEHLYDLQRQTNSPGLLSVLTLEADGEPAIGVLKLEREVGVHVLVERVAGRQVIDLEYLRDLTLTRKTRVFKAAVLSLEDAADAMSLRGIASDDQRSREEARGIARFFLRDFLGCRLFASPEKATEDFWTGAQTFISEDVAAAPERQARYQVALQAYLEEDDQDFRPETFINRAIEDQDQPRLRQRLRDLDLDPRETFGKDTGLIARKLERFRVVYEHGMVLTLSPQDVAEERAVLPGQNGAGAETTLRDGIANLSGR